MNTPFRVVTIASELNNQFILKYLLPSCEKNKLNLTIIKPESNSKWHGYSNKSKAMYKYLQQIDNDNEIILFTDGYDTLFQKGENEIMDAYDSIGSDLVFSGEYNCWPLGMVGQILYGDSDGSKLPYLNSGGYMGRVGLIKEFLSKYSSPPVNEFPVLRSLETHGHNLTEEFCWSDQFYWTLIFLLERDRMKIDTNGQIFEFYGPEIPNVFVKLVNEKEKEFDQLGRESNLYKTEKLRLVEKLKNPSNAAQIHFAGLVTKTIFNDMHDLGQLPEWITSQLKNKTTIDYANIANISLNQSKTNSEGVDACPTTIEE